MATYTAPPKESTRLAAPDNVRHDAYWIAPAATIATFLIFIVYSTIRAFQGKYFATHFEQYHFAWAAQSLLNVGAIQPHYWSPFYSPYIPLHWNFPIVNFPISASLYVLVFPLSFRGSCYYCRKAYYRAIFQDPGACAVKEALVKKNYTGEKKFPFNLVNFHRYTLYAAIILVFFHWHHMYDSFFYTKVGEGEHFGVGFGTLLFTLDTILLSAYTFSCHSFRHLVGGIVNRFSSSSGSKVRYGLWDKVTKLNNYHGQFFWASLITVGLTDLYVCLVSSGIITDLRFF